MKFSNPLLRMPPWAIRGGPFTVARFLARDAIDRKIPLLHLLLAGLILALGLFLGQLALLEQREMGAAFCGAALRWLSCMLLILYVVTQVSEERQSGIAQMTLAAGFGRGVYLLGKYIGFMLVAGALVMVNGLLLLAFAEPGQTLLWCLALLGELSVLVAASLFVSVSVQQNVSATGVVVAFYLLCRSLGALLALTGSDLAPVAWWGDAMNGLLLLLSWTLPRLDQFTPLSWLVYGAGSSAALADLLGRAGLGSLLLLAAANLDFRRREW